MQPAEADESVEETITEAIDLAEDEIAELEATVGLEAVANEDLAIDDFDDEPDHAEG